MAEVSAYENFQFQGVAWESSVVHVRLGCFDPEEHTRYEDTDFESTFIVEVKVNKSSTVQNSAHQSCHWCRRVEVEPYYLVNATVVHTVRTGYIPVTLFHLRAGTQPTESGEINVR
jgi:hypothetical protein